MCAVFIFIVKYPLFRLLIGVFTQNARKNRMDLINNCGYLCGIIRRNVSINEDYLSIMKSRYLKQYLELKKHKMAGLKNKP